MLNDTQSEAYSYSALMAASSEHSNSTALVLPSALTLAGASRNSERPRGPDRVRRVREDDERARVRTSAEWRNGARRVNDDAFARAAPLLCCSLLAGFGTRLSSRFVPISRLSAPRSTVLAVGSCIADHARLSIVQAGRMITIALVARGQDSAR